MTSVCWLSLDPVRRKLDFYPQRITSRIEKAYNDRDPYAPGSCVLGSDFFNATVHFHPSGTNFQTTPGMFMGRAGFKDPGYRSVKRCVFLDGEELFVNIFSAEVNGEWRIAKSETDSEFKFEEFVPIECLLAIGDEHEILNLDIKTWVHEDLTFGGSGDRIVWEWCKGVPEREGNLLHLSDEWWSPYMYNENGLIELAFAANEASLDLILPMENGERTIIFAGSQPYARQMQSTTGKERLIRRVVKSVAEIKAMFERIKNPPVDISALISNLPDGTIPHHFFCCISQDIMKDPVVTIDGHTYDRSGIVRWFEENCTSPLTGLPLSTKVLVPNNTIKEQIQKFLAELASP